MQRGDGFPQPGKEDTDRDPGIGYDTAESKVYAAYLVVDGEGVDVRYFVEFFTFDEDTGTTSDEEVYELPIDLGANEYFESHEIDLAVDSEGVVHIALAFSMRTTISAVSSGISGKPYTSRSDFFVKNFEQDGLGGWDRTDIYSQSKYGLSDESIVDRSISTIEAVLEIDSSDRSVIGWGFSYFPSDINPQESELRIGVWSPSASNNELFLETWDLDGDCERNAAALRGLDFSINGDDYAIATLMRTTSYHLCVAQSSDVNAFVLSGDLATISADEIGTGNTETYALGDVYAGNIECLRYSTTGGDHVMVALDNDDATGDGKQVYFDDYALGSSPDAEDLVLVVSNQAEAEPFWGSGDVDNKLGRLQRNSRGEPVMTIVRGTGTSQSSNLVRFDSSTGVAPDAADWTAALRDVSRITSSPFNDSATYGIAFAQTPKGVYVALKYWLVYRQRGMTIAADCDAFKKLAILGEDGDLMLNGATITSNVSGTISPSGSNQEFIVKAPDGSVVAMIDCDNGLACKGSITTNFSGTISSTGSADFLVKNGSGDVVIKIDEDGDIVLKGDIY